MYKIGSCRAAVRERVFQAGSSQNKLEDRRRCKPGKYLVNLSGKRTVQPGTSGKSDLLPVDFIYDQTVSAEGASRL
jgi:hypothetical protein